MTNEPKTVDSKAIIDYLRNQQKKAEIYAKVEGVNFWVLIAALAVLLWEFIGIFQPTFWANTGILLSLIILTQGAVLVAVIGSGRSRVDGPLRLTDRGLPNTSVLSWLLLLIVALPSAFSIATQHRTFLSTILLALCVLIAAALIFDELKKWASGLPWAKWRKRFPTGQMNPPPATARFGTIASCSVLGYGIYQEWLQIFGGQLQLDKAAIKCICLGIAIYWLVFLTVKRRLYSASIEWIYELETDLVLGFTTPLAAAQRIEVLRLGSRLSSVMDSFFNEVRDKHDALLQAVDRLQFDAEEIGRIPSNYSIEIKARLETASKDALKEMAGLIEDHKAYIEYLKRLRLQATPWQKERLKVFEGLDERHQALFDTTRALNARLKEIVYGLIPKESK